MEELKKKTEAMLRAVLISSPRGIPLRRVDREYKSITFSPIPFTQLGFRNLEDYLRSIPHVASFTRDSDGELVLRGVASEADKHVAKLISKQKKPKLRKSAPARRPIARSRFYSVRTPMRPNTRPQTQPLTRSSHPPTRTQSSPPSLSTAIFGPKFEIPPRMKKVLQRNLDAASSNNSSRFVTPTTPFPNSILGPSPYIQGQSLASEREGLYHRSMPNLPASPFSWLLTLSNCATITYTFSVSGQGTAVV